MSDPEKKREYMRQYYADGRGYEAMKRFRQTEKGKAYHRESVKRRNHRVKQKAIEGYGGKCVCCGVIELVWLTIDHINEDGASERKVRNSTQTYAKLIREEYPEGYQVLCFNCNWAKSHGGCPHQLEN